MRSHLALALAVALCSCAALVAQAQFCPIVARDLYDITNENCAGYTACYTALCGCSGGAGTYNNSGGQPRCQWTTKPSCDNLTPCAAKFYSCVNALAGTENTGCTQLGSIKTELLGLTAGGFYNTSGLESSCRANACLFTYNMSAATACTIPYGTVCVSPVNFEGELRINGDFTGVLADPVKTANVKTAVTTDLSRILRIGVTVNTLKSGSLIVGFTAPVAATNAALVSGLAAAAASSSWLTATTAAAGIGALTVAGIGAAPTPAPPVVPITPRLAGTSTVGTAVAVLVAALFAVAF